MQKLGPLTGAIRLLSGGNVSGPREGAVGLKRSVCVRFPELRRMRATSIYLLTQC
jgi:hypothetical protein